MTDTLSDNHEPEFQDDDRLLAYVLGLDDDPELKAAAAADETLRRRLDLLRSQMTEVGDQVRSAVPHPGADYGEIGDQRWERLRTVVDDAAASEKSHVRGRTIRWLRLAAPAAAIVLLAVVGVVTLRQQTDIAGESAHAPEAMCPQGCSHERHE